jgi:uncharacterized protein (TIGR02271 family)
MNTSTSTATGERSNQVVAMFETYDQASAARDALVAAGIDRGRIELLDRSARAEDASFHYERNEGGFWSALSGMFMPDEDSHVYAEGLHRGHAMLIVRAAPGEQDHIISLLDTQNPLDVDTQAAQWRQNGWPGTYAGAQSRATQASSTATTGTARTGATEEVIPVYEEQLRIGKREVERGTVRVRSYLVETPVEQQVQLRDERVEIERRAVDRPVTAAELGSDAFRERTIDVTTRREEAVVDKEARIKEEIVVRKEADQHTETVRDTVRHTEVEVEDDRARTTTPANRSTTPSSKR